MGKQLHKYTNRLNRNFYTDVPNSKWVTNISYLHTKQGVLYLSVICDLYGRSIIAYESRTEQTVNFMLYTIRSAIRKEKLKQKEDHWVVAAPQQPRHTAL